MGKYYFKFFPFGLFAVDTLFHLKRHEIYTPSVDRFNDPFENIWIRLKGKQYKKLNHEFQKRISEKKGVFCMCSSNFMDFPLSFDSVLMWSHYADSHKGFCIMFSESILHTEDQSCKPVEIVYSDDIPGAVSVSYGSEAENEMSRILHQKHPIWKGEREVRLIFEKADSYHIIPENCIQAIFCGCKCSDAHKDILKDFASKLNIGFYILKASSEKYEFIKG